MSENPLEIAEKAKNIALDLLPAKSRERYEKEYNLFCTWKAKHNVVVVNEDAILTYIHEQSQVMKPSTVWSKYSMMKASLNVKENIDIGAFMKVVAFLKRNAVGYEPKKSKVLSRDEVNRFLKESDDTEYLLTKVAVVFGICGACRREELHSLCVRDIVEQNNALFITLSDTKTHTKRVFSVTPQGEAVCPIKLYKKYVELRPPNVPHEYFFVAYRNQKCTVQRVGIHSFGKMPRIVANYLKLPNPELYTGHCFRRTSATLAVDAGAELITLKRLGGWRSSTVAEGYIEDSMEKKKKVSKLILGEKDVGSSQNSSDTFCEDEASTSTTVNCASSSHIAAINKKREHGYSFNGNSFQFPQNCEFHFHM